MTRLAFLSTAHIHAKYWIEETVRGKDGRCVHAVWDDVAERGKKHAEIAKAPFIPNLDQLIADPKVDGFVIASENTRHLPLLRKALATGKPVLCEKPLATTATEAHEISALVERHGNLLVNGYVFPFFGEYQAVARLLENDTFGKITHIRFRNSHGGAWWRWFDEEALKWFHDPVLSGGGGMLDEGTHGVHLVCGLFGAVDSVWATKANLSGQYPAADDFGVIHLRFKNGIFGTVEGSWVQVGGISKGLEIAGSRAVLYRTNDGYFVQQDRGRSVPVLPSTEQPSCVERLVCAIRGGLDQAAHKRDLAAALTAVTVMDAATRSAETGTWVTVAQR
jgi:predicted dehydrogenase